MTPPGLPSTAVVQAVLDDVNAIRSELGLAPVVALKRGGSAMDTCPVARTIMHEAPNVLARVTHHEIGVWRGTVKGCEFFTPPTVRRRPLIPTTERFIRDYDAGRYPGMRLP